MQAIRTNEQSDDQLIFIGETMKLTEFRKLLEGHGFITKTSGDCDLNGSKLYAVFEAGQRVSPYYSLQEWGNKQILTTINEYKNRLQVIYER